MKRNLAFCALLALTLYGGSFLTERVSAQKESSDDTRLKLTEDPEARSLSSGDVKDDVRGRANAASFHDAPSDFNGDGLTDFGIARPGTPNLTWWIRHNTTNQVSIRQFGLNTDFIVVADYDGDTSDDIAIWRSGANKSSGFWVLRSSDSTVTFTQFGEPGDDPWVVADYTGDGTDDMAVYRAGANNTQSQFWVLPSSGIFAGIHTVTNWGLGNDIAIFGDYNGDNLADFTVVRDENNRSVVYTLESRADYSIGNVHIRQFGLPSDFYVPGDYDGDRITDLAVSRAQGASLLWIYRPSSGGSDVWTTWGRSSTDLEAQGDYDGDGKTDLAIWRDSGTRMFIILKSTGGFAYEPWGQAGDVPTIWEVK